MAVDSNLAQHLADIQADIFRLAKRDHGMTTRRLALLSQIPERTLMSYCTGTAMPIYALVRLLPHLPDELTSMLVEPAGKRLTSDESDPGSLDELGCEAAGFVHHYVEARADGKVTPIEKARLVERARRVGARAAAVL